MSTAPGAGASLGDWGTISVLSESSGSRKAGPPGCAGLGDRSAHPAHGRPRRACRPGARSWSGARRRPRWRICRRSRRPSGRAPAGCRPGARPMIRSRSADSPRAPEPDVGGEVAGGPGARLAGGVGAALVGRLRVPDLRDGVVRRQLRGPAAERPGRLAPRGGHLRRRGLTASRSRGRHAAHHRVHADRRLPALASRRRRERVLLRAPVRLLAARGRGPPCRGRRRDRLRRRHGRRRGRHATPPLRDSPRGHGRPRLRRRRRAVLDPARVAARGRHLVRRRTDLCAEPPGRLDDASCTRCGAACRPTTSRRRAGSSPARSRGL